uniref:Uncharacterized protein n=1 Tax=Ditylum brightwellii TaxID=49249 RepID=A0A7S2A1N5_9STRA|mmetsp:Transcript_6519/g.9862  ORF Transcript_6519/g.9862 Transcript_6519/m.9862 type:complete len:1224 (+) Transcript_6519:111-3782(+)
MATPPFNGGRSGAPAAVIDLSSQPPSPPPNNRAHAGLSRDLLQNALNGVNPMGLAALHADQQDLLGLQARAGLAGGLQSEVARLSMLRGAPAPPYSRESFLRFATQHLHDLKMTEEQVFQSILGNNVNRSPLFSAAYAQRFQSPQFGSMQRAAALANQFGAAAAYDANRGLQQMGNGHNLNGSNPFHGLSVNDMNELNTLYARRLRAAWSGVAQRSPEVIDLLDDDSEGENDDNANKGKDDNANKGKDDNVNKGQGENVAKSNDVANNNKEKSPQSRKEESNDAVNSNKENPPESKQEKSKKSKTKGKTSKRSRKRTLQEAGISTDERKIQKQFGAIEENEVGQKEAPTVLGKKIGKDTDIEEQNRCAKNNDQSSQSSSSQQKAIEKVPKAAKRNYDAKLTPLESTVLKIRAIHAEGKIPHPLVNPPATTSPKQHQVQNQQATPSKNAQVAPACFQVHNISKAKQQNHVVSPLTTTSPKQHQVQNQQTTFRKNAFGATPPFQSHNITNSKVPNYAVKLPATTSPEQHQVRSQEEVSPKSMQEYAKNVSVFSPLPSSSPATLQNSTIMNATVPNHATNLKVNTFPEQHQDQNKQTYSTVNAHTVSTKSLQEMVERAAASLSTPPENSESTEATMQNLEVTTPATSSLNQHQIQIKHPSVSKCVHASLTSQAHSIAESKLLNHAVNLPHTVSPTQPLGVGQAELKGSEPSRVQTAQNVNNLQQNKHQQHENIALEQKQHSLGASLSASEPVTDKNKDIIVPLKYHQFQDQLSSTLKNVQKHGEGCHDTFSLSASSHTPSTSLQTHDVSESNGATNYTFNQLATTASKNQFQNQQAVPAKIDYHHCEGKPHASAFPMPAIIMGPAESKTIGPSKVQTVNNSKTSNAKESNQQCSNMDQKRSALNASLPTPKTPDANSLVRAVGHATTADKPCRGRSNLNAIQNSTNASNNETAKFTTELNLKIEAHKRIQEHFEQKVDRLETAVSFLDTAIDSLKCKEMNCPEILLCGSNGNVVLKSTDEMSPALIRRQTTDLLAWLEESNQGTSVKALESTSTALKKEIEKRNRITEYFNTGEEKVNELCSSKVRSAKHSESQFLEYLKEDYDVNMTEIEKKVEQAQKKIDTTEHEMARLSDTFIANYSRSLTRLRKREANFQQRQINELERRLDRLERRRKLARLWKRRLNKRGDRRTSSRKIHPSDNSAMNMIETLCNDLYQLEKNVDTVRGC